MSHIYDFEKQQIMDNAVRNVLQGEWDLEECLEGLEGDAAVYFLRRVFQDFLEQNFGLRKGPSETISHALVREETGDAVVEALMGDETAMNRLLNSLPENLANQFVTQVEDSLQPQFQKYLETNFGLDSEIAEVISERVVTQESADAVCKALGGDQQSLHDLLKGLSVDLAVHVWRPKLRTFLQKEFGLDRRTAGEISDQFVSEQNVTEVMDALDGDKQALKRLAIQIRNDFAVYFVMKLFK